MKQLNAVAMGNIGRWINEVHARDAHQAALLFSGNGFSFIPTFQNEVITTFEKAEEYYDCHFFPTKPTVTVSHQHVRLIGDGAYTIAGMYEIEMNVGEGRGVAIGSFTQNWVLEDGVWVKSHFHSSPRGSGPS